MVDTARERAERVVDDLRPHVEAGRDVVVVEPSDAAMFLRDYGRLLPEDDFELLSANTFELMEYVEHVVDSTDADLEAIRTRAEDPGGIVYHSNCQQRTVGLAEPTVEILASLGYDVRATDVECCGMAGSFGYKTEYYELSMAVGKDVAEQIRSADGDVPILASGMSCVKQIDDLVAGDPVHPIEYLRGKS
jgi:Fe-S oxidoreductase